MPQIRFPLFCIVTAILVTTATQSTFGILVQLHSASSIPFSAEYPEHGRKLVRTALVSDDCRLIDGATTMQRTTLHFAGDTQSINTQLERLANCPGVSVTVSFATIEHECDWRLIHISNANKFSVVINLKSNLVLLDKLAIPPAIGPALVP